MDIKNITSHASYWRGFHYFKNGNVISFEKINDHLYKGKVKGTGKNVYDVELDLDHIKQSNCSCPAAFGNKAKICKHKVALYFAIHPEEAELVQLEYEDYSDEYKKRQDEYEEFYVKKANRMNEMLDKLTPHQQRNMLFGMLMADSFEEFTRVNGYENDGIDEEVLGEEKDKF